MKMKLIIPFAIYSIADDSCLMPGKLNVVKMRYTMIHVEKHEFEGITVNVPEPERLLEEKYGIIGEFQTIRCIGKLNRGILR